MSAHLPHRDTRYTIQLEHCGYTLPRHVLRFCDQFISSHETRREADEAQADHASDRCAMLRGTIA